MVKDSTEFVQVLGLSFLEFSGPNPNLLTKLFDKMGFQRIGEYAAGSMSLHNQGDINFISNPSSGGSAERFRSQHVRGASAMGFKVENAQAAYALALRLGATPGGASDFDVPSIQGVGASLIYLVDDDGEAKIFEAFGCKKAVGPKASKLVRIDHLTHNLNMGGVERMCQFYERVFGFKRIRSFDIEGKKTGLYSEVVASENLKVIIPLNESKDDLSQIAEFVQEYNGEGIQHIALLSEDIFSTVDRLSESGIPFQFTPDPYYEVLDERLPGHGEDIEALHSRRILIDGGEEQGGGYLLQIFTQNSIGPIFFEFIQRKGNKGFGEGNFQALFESIELDQERRGVLG